MCIVSDGTGMTFWKNGVKMGSGTTLYAITPVNKTLTTIMGNAVDRQVSGHVRNFRIYDRALTDTEVSAA